MSDDYKYMVNNKLIINNANNFALFEKAIYFSESSDISKQFDICIKK